MKNEKRKAKNKAQGKFALYGISFAFRHFDKNSYFCGGYA
jgi:hypothetical protein